VTSSSPSFKQPGFVENLAAQIEQLRGRELPGFMSSQAFYMCMSQYVDRWYAPVQEMISDVRGIAQEVAGQLGDVLLVQYPALRDALRQAAARVLSDAVDETTKKLNDILSREKDPFTMNDFLQQWVNKLRYDRFSEAVDGVFDTAKTPASNWQGLKEEVFVGMRQWYRNTHSVSAQASAQEMCAILEAYWNLSAKRFVDNSCMMVDREMLGQLSSSMQEHMFKFVRDDSKLEVQSLILIY
jgi:interferon-induced GTP-binding protein Mx1